MSTVNLYRGTIVFTNIPSQDRRKKYMKDWLEAEKNITKLLDADSNDGQEWPDPETSRQKQNVEPRTEPYDGLLPESFRYHHLPFNFRNYIPRLMVHS